MSLEPLLDRLEGAAGARYGGEAVSQLDHALQCAALAARKGAPESLVAAALLHDVGHLLHADPEGASAAGRDLRHEEAGARVLARLFGPEVYEPVRLHVAAKRVLARDPAYAAALSAESAHTLILQGGPMGEVDAAAFALNPYGEAALWLRRWDDEAKVPGLSVDDLDFWRPMLRQLCLIRHIM